MARYADDDEARYGLGVDTVRLLELDEALFVRVSRWHSPVLDRVMPALTQVASYSALWLVASAGLAAQGEKGRRTAAVAIGAVAVTSATVNIGMKQVARRPRPTAPVPDARSLPQPTSSSFPSGHTASAAAFSGVVSNEIPALRVPTDTVAAAVGFSRVYTGAHYPGDVLVGWLVGRGIAHIARWAAARRWPAAPSPQ